MKNIGIMTFYGASNYGANLQAYALQEVLKEKYNVLVINYKSPAIHPDYYKRTSIIEKFKDVVRGIIYYKFFKQVNIKNKKFYDFNNGYIVPSRVYTIDNIETIDSEFDIVISGSDQVWNDRLFKNDWNYLLPFLDRAKKYSYAASFGGDRIKEENVTKYKSYIEDYTSILLREHSGYSILRKLGIQRDDVRIVADPVFLLDKTEWVNKLHLNKNSQSEYILVLIISSETNALRFAESMSKITGYPVRYLNAKNLRIIDYSSFEYINDAGPIDFLNLIMNSKCVITTSFHAIAFSLIFNIPFFYELNHKLINNNDRIMQLASEFELQDYEIINADACEIGFYNWEKINERIQTYRESSLEILYDSLK